MNSPAYMIARAVLKDPSLLEEIKTLAERPERPDQKEQETYARRHGNFWLACDICGHYFGGHEWGKSEGGLNSLQLNNYYGSGVCNSCGPLAFRINILNKDIVDIGI